MINIRLKYDVYRYIKAGILILFRLCQMTNAVHVNVNHSYRHDMITITYLKDVEHVCHQPTSTNTKSSYQVTLVILHVISGVGYNVRRE